MHESRTGTPPSSAGEPSGVDALRRQQSALERAGRLHWVHWVVVALSIVITLSAWRASSRSLEEQTTRRFERQAKQVVALFSERLDDYAALLRSGTGLMVASGTLTHPQWRRYADTLDLETEFPDVGGMGVIYRWSASELPPSVARQRVRPPGFDASPAADGTVHLPIAHVTPAAFESRVLGMDLAGEPRRREAVEEALTRAELRITAPIRLAASGKPGFLMAAPFYHTGDRDEETNLASDVIVGAMIASVRAADLVAGVLDIDPRKVRVRLSDAGEPIHDEWTSDDGERDARERRLVRALDVPLYGRIWRFEIESTAAFHHENASLEPLLILAGGLLIDALLLGLFLLLTRANRGALVFASRISERLRAESARLRDVNGELARSNRELETFSCVVSHDLKAPLNSIGHLAGFLEEDFGDYIARSEPESAHAVEHNIERIKQRVAHARALIDGVLDYSGLGSRDETVETVDTRKLVEEVVGTLDARADNVVLEGSFPLIETSATRLRQVLTNLVGNAFKYHHDPDGARVIVRAEKTGAFLRFSVSDDGPGIHPRFHDHVFELFGTLESNSEKVDSTGVGLSIVKKTVEMMGGSVRLDSWPGRGATFSFDWPVRAGTDAAHDSVTGITPCDALTVRKAA